MKKKKILTMISAVAMAATMSVTYFAGCKNDSGHTHSYKEVDGSREEATCIKAGKRTLRCVCGDAYDEVIPIDPDAHDFDKDWTVVKPTETATGSAARVCNLSDEHAFSVVLPKLTEKDKYLAADETKKPNIIEEGNCHYVFEHEAGNVEFDIAIPKHEKVEGIEDVVALASSLHDTIRESKGDYVYGDPAGNDVSKSSFETYYGDNYTRVHDGGNSRDFWYSRDDKGKPFGISALGDTSNSDPRIMEDVTEEDLLGFGYSSGGGMRETYGAEDTLSAYYTASQSRAAIKYDSSYELQSDGGYKGNFSFSRMETTHFCRYNVEFTTYATGAIKTLSVTTKIIRAFMLANTFDGTNSGEVIYDDDGDIIFGEIYPISGSTGAEEYETNYEYEKDDDGNVIIDFVYEYETDDLGKTVYDEAGDPVIKKDKDGNPVYVLDDEGNRKTEPRKKYEYEYETDEDGKFILDEDGNKIFAKDVNGAKIKHPIIGDPAIFTDGYKQKPDGTPLLYKGNQIARPIPLGWKEGDDRLYYYEAGDRAPDGSYYESDHPYIAIRNVNFNQTLKVDGEKVEVNPYPAESVYIRSFDVKYNGKLVAEGDVIEVSANTPVLFDIDNVQPADTAKLDFDPLKVYLKTTSGEIELSYTGDLSDFNQNAYHIIGYFRRDDKKVLINAQYAGEITIVLRTLSGKCERELKLNIAKGKPTALSAQAYTYSDSKGTVEYIWTDTNFDYGDPDTFITLYEGQTLYVRGVASATEQNYVDASFVTLLDTGETSSEYLTLEDNLELPDGTKVSKITAKKANPGNEALGVYVNSIYESSGSPVAYQLMGVKVVAAPSVTEMFRGSYAGRFTAIKMVSSGSARPADVTVTFNPESSTGGTIGVKVSDGSNTVDNIVYSYTYDAATRAFTATYVSGRNDETFQFEFALNEVYKLTITHPTRTGRTETIVLSRLQP